LIDQMIAWLAGLPPAELYGVIALLAGLENIVPPVPADTAVALGAFLAARGAPLHPWGVYAATLVPNVVTAAGMYALARTAGRAFGGTPLGRRFFADRTMRAVHRLYRRYHFWGIFVSRFLPGYRAVVVPFAGALRLPAHKALPPVVLASALWYGVVCLVAYRLGSNWDAVRHAIAGISSALGLAAAVVTAALAWLLWRHRRRRSAQASVGTGGGAGRSDGAA
jgi:membrane protein DedA with SNARE-associated domain